MIPKIIHYCWFGRKPLPKMALKCIESWKKYFSDYEIKEWNEDNFDVNMIPYTRESNKTHKYAFVSDFARYWILYHNGGIYFDTDVEVIKSFDDIISKGPFLGIEKNRSSISINPGLGMGAEKGMSFYKEIIEKFESWKAMDETVATEPLLIKYTTETMVKRGFVLEDKYQKIDGINIYPNDYFNPYDDYTGLLHVESDTHSIHLYAKSWIEGYSPLREWVSKRYHRFLSMLTKK